MNNKYIIIKNNYNFIKKVTVISINFKYMVNPINTL